MRDRGKFGKKNEGSGVCILIRTYTYIWLHRLQYMYFFLGKCVDKLTYVTMYLHNGHGRSNVLEVAFECNRLVVTLGFSLSQFSSHCTTRGCGSSDALKLHLEVAPTCIANLDIVTWIQITILKVLPSSHVVCSSRFRHVLNSRFHTYNLWPLTSCKFCRWCVMRNHNIPTLGFNRCVE